MAKAKTGDRFDGTLAKETAALKAFLDKKPGVTASPMTAATGKTPLVLIYKVMDRTFAIMSLRKEQFVLLKTDFAEMLREKYKGIGHRSHLDRRYWISVTLDADVPAREIEKLAAISYELVRASLTKKQQAVLGGDKPAVGRSSSRKAPAKKRSLARKAS